MSQLLAAQSLASLLAGWSAAIAALFWAVLVAIQDIFGAALSAGKFPLDLKQA
jgi:hypothetical protein